MSCKIDYQLYFAGDRAEMQDRLAGALEEIAKTVNIEEITNVFTDEREDFAFLARHLDAADRPAMAPGQGLRLPLLAYAALHLPIDAVMILNELEAPIKRYEQYRLDYDGWLKELRAFFGNKPEAEIKPVDRFQLRGPEFWFYDDHLEHYKKNYLKLHKNKIERDLFRLIGKKKNPPATESATLHAAYGDAIMHMFKGVFSADEAYYDNTRLTVAAIHVAEGCGPLRLNFVNWYDSGIYCARGSYHVLPAEDPVAAHLATLECLRILGKAGLVLGIGDYSRYLYTQDEEGLREYLRLEREHYAEIAALRRAARQNPGAVLKKLMPDLEERMPDADIDNARIVEKNPPVDPALARKRRRQALSRSRARKN